MPRPSPPFPAGQPTNFRATVHGTVFAGRDQYVERLHDEIESSLTRISAISVAVAGIGGDDTNAKLHEECLAEMQELVLTSDAFKQQRSA